MRTMFNTMRVLHTMMKVGRIKMKVIQWNMGVWSMGTINANIKLKSQTIEAIMGTMRKEYTHWVVLVLPIKCEEFDQEI
jgi:hypothetical protein